MLEALRSGGGAETLSREHLSAALEEMMRGREELTRAMLGGAQPVRKGPLLPE
ncbi:hypothetical protein ABT158_27570 [Nonomuraea sp. NPDC001636]|uniref:hypothetical protein n=1 Tax=Nonomuraea sp. NPDC001636 TaxID=3154391 RepID=UPI003329E9DF